MERKDEDITDESYERYTNTCNGVNEHCLEYKLHFQNIKKKREISHLTTTIKEMESQLDAAKKRNKFLSKIIDDKLTNAETVFEHHGIQYMFISTREKNELKTEIKHFETTLKKTMEENRELESINEKITQEQELMKKRLSIVKEAGDEKANLVDNLKKQIEKLEQILNDTEIKLKNKSESHQTKVQLLTQDITEAKNQVQVLKEQIKEQKGSLVANSNEIDILCETKNNLDKLVQTKDKQINDFTEQINLQNTEILVLSEALSREIIKLEEYERTTNELKLIDESTIVEATTKLKEALQTIDLKSEEGRKLRERIKKLEKELEKVTPRARWK